MVTNRIHDLIEKYVDGSASEAEREELLAWCTSVKPTRYRNGLSHPRKKKIAAGTYAR